MALSRSTQSIRDRAIHLQKYLNGTCLWVLLLTWCRGAQLGKWIGFSLSRSRFLLAKTIGRIKFSKCRELTIDFNKRDFDQQKAETNFRAMSFARCWDTDTPQKWLELLSMAACPKISPWMRFTATATRTPCSVRGHFRGGQRRTGHAEASAFCGG